VLDLGDGRFRPVAVDTGRRSEGWTEVLSGIEPGQQVVVSAQFLLDSEAALRTGLGRLDADAHEH
jgi:Cu(I)/Ag(I) efflux system membrane fusion protein